MNAPPTGAPDGRCWVGLRLRDRRVVVVGGGQRAHRAVAAVLDAGAAVCVISPVLTPALEALAARGSVTWMRRRYQPGDLVGAWYAVAATGEPAVEPPRD
jgi:uroporphyrin-III C-methyltransferase / precorrin-2 dehydrogenase / sirohydrochlorin ferrochelatase